MDTIWAEYGESVTIPFDLWELDNTDLQQSAVHAAGDTTICKDGGAEANTANGFVDEGKGYSIALTFGELTAGWILLYIIDQTGPKAWRDRVIRILTYGHPSAFDRRGVIAKGTCQAGSTVDNVILDASDPASQHDWANGSLIEFYSGTGADQRRIIADFDFGTKVALMDPPLLTAPDATTKYRRLGTPPTNVVADLSAVKTKTDQLRFTSSNQVDATVQRLNATPLTGSGTPSSPWGP